MTNQGIERVAPILKFVFRGVEVKLHGVRQDKPPKMVEITYELIVDTNESDRRLELLHENVRKFWHDLEYRCGGDKTRRAN